MDIDDVYTKIGDLGRFQVPVLASIMLVNIWGAIQMIHIVFLGEQPKHHTCHNNDSLALQDYCPNSNNNLTCDRYSYNDSDFTSIATEWDLICEKSNYAGLVQSIFMAGVLCGALIFGPLSDKYGRRKIYLGSLTGMTLFSFIGSFAWNYTFYTATRFITGAFVAGVALNSFILSCEFVGSSRRVLITSLSGLMLPLGMMVFSLLAYFIRNWRILSITTSLPGLVLLILTACIVPESPRWLLIHGDTLGAEDIIHKMAKLNKKPLETLKLREPEKTHTKSHGIFSLFVHFELCKRMMILTYSWFVCSCVYYGLTMSAGSLSGSIHINIVLSAAVEIPAYILLMPLISKFGRRWIFSGSLLLGGVSCGSIMVTPAHLTIAINLLALVGKLAISGALTLAYLYSAELYPTIVRNSALGVCTMAARFGGMVAPAVSVMDDWRYSFAVFGCMSFTSGLLASILPETGGMAMPETIEDIVGRSQPKELLEVSSEPRSESKIVIMEAEHEEEEIIIRKEDQENLM